MKPMPKLDWPRFTAIADHGLLVSFGDAISDETSAAVIALDQALATNPPLGLSECVPAFVNLLIEFDPLQTDHSQMRTQVELLLLRYASSSSITGQLREVEICYDEDFGPDLAAVTRSAGMSVEEAVDLHVQAEYRVRMYGFAPGYAYLSGVPLALRVPRKPSVVRDVPAGSVLIAGPQCLVTTMVMPTGWSIIGRSPTAIFTPGHPQPFLFGVGDQVQFKRIDRARYEHQLKAYERNAVLRHG